MPRAGLSYRGKASLRTTSQSASQTAPLVGEPLAKPFTLRGLPKPPLGRGGGSASALTERLSPAAAHGQALLRTTSQSASLDKAGLRLPASAALRLRLAGRCPNSDSLFPPLAAVVAVAPGRGASGETVHFAGPCRRGYFSNRSREFVENARQKREEFVKVIKMRRRY